MGWALELELRAMLKQLARLPVEFERSETDPLCGWDWHTHHNCLNSGPMAHH